MDKSLFHSLCIASFFGLLVACGNSNSTNAPETEDIKKDSVVVENTTLPTPLKPGKYEDVLKKFKLISFDTLKVFFDNEDEFYKGKELTFEEARMFPYEMRQSNLSELSGIFVCYQFQIDSVTLGLIARTPSEYESSSIKLFLFDTRKDRLLKNYYELGQNTGDAGEAFQTTSWIFKTKDKQFQAFVYDYSSYDHGVEDTSDHTIDEWKNYYLINCSSPKFDVISKNEAQLKKRFKRILKAEE